MGQSNLCSLALLYIYRNSFGKFPDTISFILDNFHRQRLLQTEICCVFEVENMKIHSWLFHSARLLEDFLVLLGRINPFLSATFLLCIPKILGHMMSVRCIAP